MSPSDEVKEVVILGGGIASLSAALELTDPKRAHRPRVTVYQMGWRLGGKGASGRNPEKSQRIEEHGLHIWFGFYENAFHLMQRCYEENEKLGPTPFPTWHDAFKEQSFLVWEDLVNGQWVHNPITFPTNKFTPGAGERVLSAWQYVLELLKVIQERLATSINT